MAQETKYILLVEEYSFSDDTFYLKAAHRDFTHKDLQEMKKNDDGERHLDDYIIVPFLTFNDIDQKTCNTNIQWNTRRISTE